MEASASRFTLADETADSLVEIGSTQKEQHWLPRRRVSMEEAPLPAADPKEEDLLEVLLSYSH